MIQCLQNIKTLFLLLSISGVFATQPIGGSKTGLAMRMFDGTIRKRRGGIEVDKEQVFDKAQYDQDYNKRHMIRKQIVFNKLKPDDMVLLEWLMKQANRNEYIKDLIRQDMKNG